VIDKEQKDRLDAEFLAQYYTNSDFYRWLQKNGFNQQTASSIGNYFALFQQELMCEEKRCYDCAGLMPCWETEKDVKNGRIRNKKCPIFIQQASERKGKSIADRIIIPKNFEHVTLDDLPEIPEEVKQKVKSFIDLFPNNKPYGLYIYANRHGVGRTSLMWIIVKELLRRNKIFNGFIFHTTAMFIDALQTDMFTHEHYFRRKAIECDLLVLDDFGRERETDWSSGKIEAIFEERTWNGLPIILSSTLPPDPWVWQDKKEKSLMSKISKATQILRLTEDDNGRES